MYLLNGNPVVSHIVVHCECGKSYKVPATSVGRRAKCKACGCSFAIEETSESNGLVQVLQPGSAMVSIAQDSQSQSAPAPTQFSPGARDTALNLQKLDQSDQQGPHQLTILYEESKLERSQAARCEKEIRDYLRYSPDVFRTVNLEIRIFSIGPNRVGVGAEVRGTVNNEPFNWYFEDWQLSEGETESSFREPLVVPPVTA